MAEIYRDKTTAGLTFDVAGATVTSAEFSRGGEVVSSATGNPVLVPYAITKRSGDFTVKWTYSLQSEEHTRLETHSIITPMFTAETLVDWDADFAVLSDKKVVYLETLVRQIIETYCQQKFEYATHTVVLGVGPNGVYYSPEKVISLSNANYTLGDGGFSVHNLDTYTSQGYNVKIPIEAEAYELTKGWHAPRPARTITVTGDFGWVSIPSEVKTAALYLAEAFTCDESLWRERLIKSVRAADWRFDYSEEAFHSTGSLIADQLLDPFRRIGFAAV